MRCFSGTALILMIVLALVSVSGGISQSSAGHLLYQSLENVGVKVDLASVQGWAELPTGAWSAKELETTVRQGLAAVYNPISIPPIAVNCTPEQRSAQSVVANSDEYFRITATVRPGIGAFVSVLFRGPAAEAAKYRQDAAKILYYIGERPQISSCLAGWIDGKLNNGEWTNILTRSFAVLRAAHIEEMRDARLVSVTGYSPRLPGGLVIGGETVNVNISSRYSSYDNRTYITLGTPIIEREY